MASPPTERGLLFGILALQNNFISRESLLAALGNWSVDQGQPLDEVLLSYSNLNLKQRELLKALTDEHLSQHEVALQTAEEGVEQLQRMDSTARLAAPVNPAFDPWQTLDVPERKVAPSSVRYSRLRPHAQGGLGEVFVARDTELNREVALKEIRPQHADDLDSRARFVLEAEVTGGLEHPGIVPVYGFGAYPDGRPFYAMRFIRGENLKGAIRRFRHTQDRSIAQKSLEMRKLLGHFITVCQTIEYAHSRGVLHRDLKPGNIMLGEYGETLVVDWGLAKPQTDVSAPEPLRGQFIPQSGSGSTATQLGTAVGTPAYMSPEQAAGRWDQIGPASDVYCLGATLYEILTGQPPLSGDDVGQILQRAERGDFPRPREINSSISRPLEAICLKAMARLPSERYASAAALAQDVQRWLANEETIALPDTRLGKASRWLQHHRTVARMGVGTIISVAFIAILSAALIHQQKRQVERLTGEIFQLSHQLQDADSHHDHERLQSEARRKVEELNYWSSDEQLETSSAKAVAPKWPLIERLRSLKADETNDAPTDPK